MIAAIIPALLCTILIFMDQQITAVIINRKEHKLKVTRGSDLGGCDCSWLMLYVRVSPSVPADVEKNKVSEGLFIACPLTTKVGWR